MSEELKPCPFCGDNGDKGTMQMFAPQTGLHWTKVTCRGCGASVSDQAWNIRAQDSELAALRDKYAILEESRDAEMLKVTNRDVDIAALRTKLEEVRGILAGPDAGSLPNDYPLDRMATDRMEERNKFMWQVRDTCTRAEEAERKLAEAARWSNEWAAEVARVKAEFSELVVSHTDLLHQLQRALDAEKTARAEGMEEAAQVCAEDESGRDSGGYFADAIRAKMKEQK